MYNLSFTYQSGFITSLFIVDFESLCDTIELRLKDNSVQGWFYYCI